MPSSYTVRLSSIKNLNLAWSRIKTGQNIFYKNYYRNLFLAYELAYKDNISRLSERLQGGAYKPSSILRFYLPKASGLHRPISFLHLEDLIVYQAYANLFFDKFKEARKEVERINVFSNIFNEDKSKEIFLFKKWQEGYRRFLQKIKASFYEGYTWIVHFDIAAYYDTISHTALISQVAPRSSDEYRDMLEKCLRIWSTPKKNILGHGIPQGPLSSNLIGEVYFIPIDRILNKKKVRYLRYVDDIKIFGKTREEVLNGVMILEKECKERGLIPQSKKFEIIKAANYQEAIGKSPSISDIEKKYFLMDENETSKIFKHAFNQSPMDITRIKYILKSTGKNYKILRTILNKLNDYPELSDEFCAFLRNYSNNSKYGKAIFGSALKTPSNFEYVHGNYWNLLSYFNLDNQDRIKYNSIAIKRLKNAKDSPALRVGLYRFLSSNNKTTVLKWLMYERNVLLQMMIMNNISSSCYNTKEFIDFANLLLKRSNFESSLALYKELIYNLRSDIFKKLNKPEKDYSGILRNTMGIPGSNDNISVILTRRYKVKYIEKFKSFLGSDYEHSNHLILNADNSYDIDRNAWISYTDSFNDIVVRNFIILLNKYVKLPSSKSWPHIYNKKGEIIDYGILLDKANLISIKYHHIIDGFRLFHVRRSETPTSHAFDKKSKTITRFVRANEQKSLTNILRISYTNLISEIDSIIP